MVTTNLSLFVCNNYGGGYRFAVIFYCIYSTYCFFIGPLIGCNAGENPILGDKAAGKFDNYKETGDLNKIRKREHLRLLVPYVDAAQSLPREGLLREAYRELAEAFTHKLNIAPQFVVVDGFDELIPALLAGKGDVAAVAEGTYDLLLLIVTWFLWSPDF